MLVHRMVKDIKNSKVLHKIKTKDAYTAQQLYQQFKSQHLLDDRREYDEEDLMSAYPGLSKEEAKKLFDMLQRSTDAADLSLSKDNLIDAMGSGYTPVHVQKNRQGVFIVFKSDKDGKFYIVEKRSKQLFSVATSLAMAKRIIGETEDSKSKDADPRGFKVNDQIIKGFMVYKMDKNPALFVAKNENGQQYEGSLDDVRRQIDKYWEKKDAEEVLKKKTGDDKVPLEEVSKTVSELYNEYGAVLTPDKVIIKFIRKYGLTSSDIDRLMPSIKLALRMLPKVKDEVLKKKTEDDESIRGKDGYILRVYKSGSGYNWEVYDPEGQKTKTGLSAGSVQHAKESADQKLGMKIFVDSKPTTDALDSVRDASPEEEKVKQYISSIHNPSKRKYAEEYFHYEQGRSQQPKRPSDLSAMGAQAVEMRIQQLLEGGVSDQAPVSRQSAVKMNVGGKKCPCGGQFVQSSVEELSGGRKKRTEKCDKCGRSQIIITDRKTVTDALDPDETHDIRDIEKEKTKQEAINECKKYIESRESEIKDSKTKDAGGFIGVATAKPGKYFTGYRTEEKSPLFDNEKDAKEWCRFRMQRQDAKHISKCEVVKTSDSKTKHPRWRIKDDKLFRLRSAVKDIRRRVKDAELNSRAVWKKEDFDKMVASGNFVIVSKQPWGYEVRVKSGNIYGVEIKDSYTKGSADRKTKDDNQKYHMTFGNILFDYEQEPSGRWTGLVIGSDKPGVYRNHHIFGNSKNEIENKAKELIYHFSLDKFTGDPLKEGSSKKVISQNRIKDDKLFQLRSGLKRKTKDAGNPTILLAKRSGWIGDFGYLPNMLIYLSLRPDGQVSVGANAPSKYGTNIPLSRIKQAIAKGDIEIGHRGEVDI